MEIFKTLQSVISECGLSQNCKSSKIDIILLILFNNFRSGPKTLESKRGPPHSESSHSEAKENGRLNGSFIDKMKIENEGRKTKKLNEIGYFDNNEEMFLKKAFMKEIEIQTKIQKSSLILCFTIFTLNTLILGLVFGSVSPNPHSSLSWVLCLNDEGSVIVHVVVTAGDSGVTGTGNLHLVIRCLSGCHSCDVTYNSESSKHVLAFKELDEYRHQLEPEVDGHRDPGGQDGADAAPRPPPGDGGALVDVLNVHQPDHEQGDQANEHGRHYEDHLLLPSHDDGNLSRCCPQQQVTVVFSQLTSYSRCPNVICMINERLDTDQASGLQSTSNKVKIV